MLESALKKPNPLFFGGPHHFAENGRATRLLVLVGTGLFNSCSSTHVEGLQKTKYFRFLPLSIHVLFQLDLGKDNGTLKILYASQGGCGEVFALRLRDRIKLTGSKCEVKPSILSLSFPSSIPIKAISLSCYDAEELPNEEMVIFIVSTYEGGRPPDECAEFFKWLEDYHNDFRVSRDSLKALRFAIFGLGMCQWISNLSQTVQGNSTYESNFNKVAIQLNKFLSNLGGRHICRLVLGDEESGYDESFMKWEMVCSSLSWKILFPPPRS